MSFFGKSKKKTTNKPDAEKWLEAIEQAKKVKHDWRKKFRVDLAYSYRDGAQRPTDVSANDWITVNMVYSTLKAELPKKYSGDPYFYIKLAKSYSPDPRRIQQMELNASVRQDMLNYLKNELELKPSTRTCILDAYFQFGVTKTRFTADLVDNPDFGSPMFSEDQETVIADEPETIPVNEQYKIERIHPDDFLVDSEAGPLDASVKWKAQRIKRPLAAAKKDKNYNASARKSLVATEATEDEVQKAREERKKGLAAQNNQFTPDTVIIWEIYDLENNKWLAVSEGCKDFLITPEDLPEGIERDPFNVLRLGLERDDSYYPVPPVSQWLDSQREKNELRSKILTHRKRFNRKYEVIEEYFDDPSTIMSLLEFGGDGTCIPRKQGMGPGIFPIADAPLDHNHIQELAMLDNDFREVAASANQRGSGYGIDSATEAGIVANNENIIEGDDLSLIREFVSGIGRKVDQLVQANLTNEVAVKVTGPQGEYWELVKPENYEEIEGEFQYSINVGSTLPQLPEIERSQWMAFLSLISNNPHLALSKSLLKKMAEMHHIEDERMVDELYQIAKQIMGGQIQQPGQTGSLPNVASPATRSASVVGGQAGGINNIRGGAQ